MPRPLKIALLVGLPALVLMGVVGGVFFQQALKDVNAQKAAALEVFGRVPNFSLVERSGRPFSQAELDGKVWLAAFIFTYCAGPCPLISTQMSALQEPLLNLSETDIRLVSFSVDPERDTPAVLADYARRYQADGDRWVFLTGEKKAMYRLIREGFRMVVEDGADVEAVEEYAQILHSLRVALVDRKGQVRAYYNGADPELADDLLPDVERLLREK